MGASSYLGSQTSASESATNQEQLPQLSPKSESYLLNGIVRSVEVNRQDYENLVSSYKRGHLFTATRLPARKRTF